MASAPKYNRCDTCGRNAHKVALRNKNREVLGYCPSCFEWALERYGLDGHTLVYDRRGAAAKKRCPMPERLLPTRDRLDANGLRVWKRCGHRAELDALGGCYTCRLVPFAS